MTWNALRDEFIRIEQTGNTANVWDIKKQIRPRFTEASPWRGVVPAFVFHQATEDFRRAVRAYRTKAKRGQNPSLPSVRSRMKHSVSVNFPAPLVKVDGQSLRLGKIGKVNMAEPLRFPGRIKSVRVIEKGGKWYAAFAVEMHCHKSRRDVNAVGIDFGISSLATLSDGQKYEPLRAYKNASPKLKALRSGLSKKRKGSKGWHRQQNKIVALAQKIKNARKDFLHKFSTAIIAKYSVIGVETLDLKTLTTGPLSGQFQDASLGKALQFLQYKAATSCAVIQKVDKYFASSKLCNVCSHKNATLGIWQREWTCSNCQTYHDRDLNAAKNLLREGVRLFAGSGHVGVTPVINGHRLCLETHTSDCYSATGTSEQSEGGSLKTKSPTRSPQNLEEDFGVSELEELKQQLEYHQTRGTILAREVDLLKNGFHEEVQQLQCLLRVLIDRGFLRKVDRARVEDEIASESCGIPCIRQWWPREPATGKGEYRRANTNT